MTPPRRRVIHPTSNIQPVASVRLPRLRLQLKREQQSLANWTAKLKRAFHSFEKHQEKAARLQRKIRELEEH